MFSHTIVRTHDSAPCVPSLSHYNRQLTLVCVSEYVCEVSFGMVAQWDDFPFRYPVGIEFWHTHIISRHITSLGLYSHHSLSLPLSFPLVLLFGTSTSFKLSLCVSVALGLRDKSERIEFVLSHSLCAQV